MTRLLLAIAALTVIPATVPVAADVTLSYADASGEVRMTMQIADDTLRIDNGSDVTTLMDAGQRRIVSIQHGQRSYAVMDQAMAEKVAEQLRQATAMLERLPASARAMAEQAMKAQMGGDGIEVSVRDTGREDQVAGYSCDVYESLRNGQVETESCVASLEDTGMPAADYAAMERVFTFATDLVTTITEASPIEVDFRIDWGALEGVAVRIEQDGEMLTLSEISTDAVPASRFAVPTGYAQQDMGM